MLASPGREMVGRVVGSVVGRVVGRGRMPDPGLKVVVPGPQP
jgi:hypothetical protein